MTSILSTEPDQFGFYYGFYENDPRQINVRFEDISNETGAWFAPVWVVYVGGIRVAVRLSKGEAESAAIEWIKEHKDG